MSTLLGGYLRTLLQYKWMSNGATEMTFTAFYCSHFSLSSGTTFIFIRLPKFLLPLTHQTLYQIMHTVRVFQHHHHTMSAPETNARGIPKAPFVDNVAEFVAKSGVKESLDKFQEMLQKYKYMEMTTLQRQAGLKEKIPDIAKSLEMVEFLQSKAESGSDVVTSYELNDTLYTEAKIEASGVKSVYLWLGANVMLEYEIEEAKDLLSERLEGAKRGYESAEEDVLFLRENITTVEVNIARVHNWDVNRRKKEREEAEANK